MTPNTSETPQPSRRDFLSTSAAVVGTTALTAHILNPSAVYAGSCDDVIKVGLIGCGGRGTGAAGNTLGADPHSEIVAIGDLFPDKLQPCLDRLKKLPKEQSARVKVTPETMFSGFDAYQKVIDSGVDLILLATPPHFRPIQLDAAIEAGKHVFCEKPVGVDAVGLRKVRETCKKAAEKNLTVVSGLCWRYAEGMNEIIKRIQDGAIGEIKAVYSTRFNSGVERRVKRTEKMTDIEYQLRNWYYYTWLSCDFMGEQFVHELDKISWMLNDATPVRILATGGRETRTDKAYGNIFDHFSTTFEFENGLRYHATSRQQAGCGTSFQDLIVGTEGTADLMKYKITGKNAWRRKEKDKNSMYHNEHVALYKAIRSGKPINNGEYMVNSSMMGISGRMSAYTGKELTWEKAMNSNLDLSPSEYSFQAASPAQQIAVPGVTPFV